MDTLKKSWKTLSSKQMSSISGGRVVRIFYYDENGQLTYRDVIVD